MKNKIGIVMVNYNGLKFQNDCLKTLYNQEYQNFEVVVVDSNSHDDSIKKLRENYPQVHVICENENVGVAVGNNIGIKYCLQNDAEYILLLNNDTELDPMLLSNLINKASPKCIVVPKIYFYSPNNWIWFGGGYLDWNKASGYHIGLKEIDKGQFDEEKDISYSPTCCMLIHKDVFNKIGLIDENTFMYYDDTDFCVRLLDNGYRIRYVPSAYLWHKVSSSSGGMSNRIGVYYNNRNQLYFMCKYRERISFVSKLIIHSKKIIKALLGTLKNSTDKYIFIAYLDFLHKRMGRKDF